MEWPSKNVAPGGLFHTKTVPYTPERGEFLKLLIEETKMSTNQRKNPNYFYRSDKPFPSSSRRSVNNVRRSQVSPTRSLPTIRIRPKSSKKRSMDDIIKSGAFERIRYIPLTLPKDRQKEIAKLQAKMANEEEEIPKLQLKKSKQKIEKDEEKDEPNHYDLLLEQIQERQEFLDEMTKLGFRKQYEAQIQNEIDARIRSLEKLRIDNEKKSKSKLEKKRI